MLSSELINHNIPRLQLQDFIIKAKQLMVDYKTTHLPVTSENKFIGLISEEDLLDFDDEKLTIQVAETFFLKQFIFEDVHFLNAINFCNLHSSNIIPVLNHQQDFIGVITTEDLLKMTGIFTGSNEIGGIIVLELDRIQFSISEISRIVESNDATIYHLNTFNDPKSEKMLVTLHINNREISSIVATFIRYEYHVKYHFGVEHFEEKTEANYKNLMNYLGI